MSHSLIQSKKEGEIIIVGDKTITFAVLDNGEFVIPESNLHHYLTMYFHLMMQ